MGKKCNAGRDEMYPEREKTVEVDKLSFKTSGSPRTRISSNEYVVFSQVVEAA
jgi:hypothetical protein